MVRGADFVTLVNALLGTTAVLSLITPLPLPGDLTAGDLFIVLVTLGLIFDGLDGLVARRFGISRAGRMLDSLSDAITFGLAPAAYVAFAFGAWALPAVLLFMAAALYRLALFTTLSSDKTVFHGLPSPVAGITLLLAALLPAEVLPVDPLVVVFPLAVALGALMVSGVRYPKVRGRYQPALVAFAALAAVHLVLYFAAPQVRSLVVASGIGISVAVVLAAPLLLPEGTGTETPEGAGPGGETAAEATSEAAAEGAADATSEADA